MTVLQDTFEANRLRLQSELDAGKTQAERNRLGQFATPTALALDILTYASTLIPEDEPVRFLDPAVGTGSFFSAFRQVFPAGRIDSALGFEVDTHYGEPATHIWRDTGFTIRLAFMPHPIAATAQPRMQFDHQIPPFYRNPAAIETVGQARDLFVMFARQQVIPADRERDAHNYVN